jgi:DNA-binding MarR family transcriptional regulator
LFTVESQLNKVKIAEMKQSKKSRVDFDLDEFLPYLLNQAAEVTSQNFQSVYRDEYDMTRTQWRVLANLEKHGAMTATEICRATFIEKTKMSRAVQALEEKGFLSRGSIAGDRRSEQLSLTAEGASVFRTLGKSAAAYDLSLRKQLGHDVAIALEDVLKTLMQSAKD